MFEIVVAMDSIKAATWFWQQMEEGPQDLGKKKRRKGLPCEIPNIVIIILKKMPSCQVKSAKGRFAKKFPRGVDQITTHRELEALNDFDEQQFYLGLFGLILSIVSRCFQVPCEALDLLLAKHGNITAINTSQAIHRMGIVKGDHHLPCLTPRT